jgi:uncharacterized protein (DUF2141 family)
MKITQRVLITTSLLLGSLISANTFAHELELKLDKIKNIKGFMMIALYNSADSYKSDVNTFSGKKIAVSAKTMTVNFSNLPSGDYAIKLYQDENDNGEIDKNFLGIPTEAYGFSNNGGAMGQPSFDEAKFTVNGNTSINIHLH